MPKEIVHYNDTCQSLFCLYYHPLLMTTIVRCIDQFILGKELTPLELTKINSSFRIIYSLQHFIFNFNHNYLTSRSNSLIDMQGITINFGN